MAKTKTEFKLLDRVDDGFNFFLDYRQIAKMLDEFDNWAMNYEGKLI